MRYLKKIEMIQILKKNLKDCSRFLQTMEHVLKSAWNSQVSPYTKHDIEDVEMFIKDNEVNKF